MLFVGFQAENTLGRRILDGVSPVKIFGEEYDVRAQVASIDGYSAHADQAELLEWAQPLTGAGFNRPSWCTASSRPRSPLRRSCGAPA